MGDLNATCKRWDMITPIEGTMYRQWSSFFSLAAHTFSESAASRIASANDGSPGFKMSSMHNSNWMMIADLSRQRMTLETANHLSHLRLAQSVDVKGFILILAFEPRFEPVKPASINGGTSVDINLWCSSEFLWCSGCINGTIINLVTYTLNKVFN